MFEEVNVLTWVGGGRGGGKERNGEAAQLPRVVFNFYNIYLVCHIFNLLAWPDGYKETEKDVPSILY